ncbi:MULTISPECIES: DNA-binding domain-containing protein [unclassified Undibacterium]|uniref:DNA-binding domain-containing protein n=1 Tax=unclassified Undibacterium TaxID=2630295 RepID=UPI002AC8F308|nr:MULTISPECIES: DNA-binding domain-containing protein [unclassified Undibacterium]MEB0139187.1 DNA-binding domain-containing protein [Undibacterium sp. CCC2.1]MEB0172238.1 DNA-binding domain-containing protein [Undibacterium sp. CCC1.1]MEB0175905.1 DNA-binding domain-containing protein [Undibacterium sp. CCC3.4]MEB0215235.1 DNA-binding domain-containing protein [Undibacterium sp. 5I2]WPX43533.1 DNA-binding domain-containing protein [Undibacterium sp. CCC3.4]
MNSLASLQSQFAAALAAPKGWPDSLLATPMLDERFAFYRGNQHAVQLAALRHAYPVVEQLGGAEFFSGMARAYAHSFPSQSGDLHEFGLALPQFLRAHASDYPYFADVATLEWQLQCAYYAENSPTLSLTDCLAQAVVAGSALDSARLLPHPAASLHHSASAAISVWQAHQGAGTRTLEAGTLMQACYGLVTRTDWRAGVIALDLAHYRALQALFAGHSVAAALEVLLEHEAAADVGAAVRQWFDSAAFTSVRFTD